MRKLGIVFAALLLVGCDDSASSVTGTVTSTVTEASVAKPAPSAPSPSPTTEPTKPQDSCSALDLSDTQFGPFTATNRVPTDVADTWFSFQIKDNKFDPCLDLSYVTLDGSLGDQNGIGGTGGSIGSAVAFFAKDRLITTPAPAMYYKVQDVKRVANDKITVTYAKRVGPTAAGQSEPVEVTYSLAGDTLNVTGPEAEGAKLNFAGQPQTSQLEPIKLGNVHSKPYAEYKPKGTYRLPLASGENLVCELDAKNGVIADCTAEFPTTWKEGGPQGEQATRVRYTATPAAVVGVNEPPTKPHPETLSLTPGAKTAVGHVIVDLTQPHTALIQLGETPGGLKITPDSYELVGQ